MTGCYPCEAVKRVLLAIECVALLTAVILGIIWIQNPSGPYEPIIFVTLLLGSSVVEFIRRTLSSAERRPESIGDDTAAASLDQDRAIKFSSTPHVAEHWQGVLPKDSKYTIVQETADSIPAGLQHISLEYAPQGHAGPLKLKDGYARADIHFTCQVANPYKVMFAANEYALNILEPRFLVAARSTLEKFTSASLRSRREQIAIDIVNQLSPMFEELGMSLETVTIGSIEKLGRRSATTQRKA